MLVSVIIPTKDRSGPLIDAVQSVFDGSYQNFEVIVVDQTLGDATRAALEQFSQDPRFHYHRNSRATSGQSSSRNVGIALSSGDIVAFIDDDVTACADWMATMVAEFEADPALQFICGKMSAPSGDNRNGVIPEFDPERFDPSTTSWNLVRHIAGGNLAMRRAIFNRVGGFDENFGAGTRLNSDDGDIGFRIVRTGAKWKVSSSVEVVHTHGFRPGVNGTELLKSYSIGDGANFGRFTRHGDIVAGLWFLQTEVRGIVRVVVSNLSRGRLPRRFGWARWRLVGFWKGFTLPPRKGFLTAEDLAQLRQELLSTGDRAG